MPARPSDPAVPVPHLPGDTAPAHRDRLLDRLTAQAPDAAPALSMIRQEIAGLSGEAHRRHIDTHLVRFLLTYMMAPQGPGRVVDIGGPSIHNVPLERLKQWRFDTVEILAIDYERDPLPFETASCDGVLLCEVIEHFVIDPLFCLHEVNRILRPGGFLLITTPNAASWFAIFQALAQRHPSRWPVYSGTPEKARHHIHAREYLVSDLSALVEAAGFRPTSVQTSDYGIAPEYQPIPGFPTEHRGETIFLCATKLGPPLKRFTPPLYVEDVPAG
ncbi:MAG: methyltransferase domain-containing protein [Pseudomonadota bacterium]